jgi:hypothetical protein
MATRFLLKRAIAIGVAMLLIFAACFCYLRRAEDSPDLQDWLRSGCMAALDVDFSKPGEYSVSFEARHVDPVLELEISRDVGSRASPEVLLSGLRATSELIDSRGEVLSAGRIPEGTPRFFPPDSGRIRLVEYGYSGVERHKINVVISQPALALKGVPHRLVVASLHWRSGTSAPVCLGHAALFTAVAILIAVAIMSRRKPNHGNKNQGQAE